MADNESGLWRELKRAMARDDFFTYGERLETRAGGLPDVLINTRLRYPLFIELKIGHRREKTVFMKFRKIQPLWHEQFAAGGGISFILAKFGPPVSYFLFRGFECRKITKPLTEADLARYALLKSGSLPAILTFIRLHAS